jgi:acetyltransferase-like isoleucine patch superfamily enzyme
MQHSRSRAIGVNADATHDIPLFSVAVSAPTRVIKTLKAEKK